MVSPVTSPKLLWIFVGVILLSAAASLKIPSLLDLPAFKVEERVMLGMIPVLVFFLWQTWKL